MNPDKLFLLCNYGVLPAWLLLAVAPHHRLTQQLVHAVWIPLVLGPFYIHALFFGAPAPEGGGFGSLQEVMALFTSPTAVLTAATFLESINPATNEGRKRSGLISRPSSAGW